MHAFHFWRQMSGKAEDIASHLLVSGLPTKNPISATGQPEISGSLQATGFA